MKQIITILVAFLPIISYAQSNKLLEIDQNSFAPVQTDVMTGVGIDKIGTDPSKRPCARIKMHINRMTKEDIEGVRVRTVGGSTVVTRQVVSSEGNGLIVEMTAKSPTRFYLHHDQYGESNEVSVNLEGNKEYRIEAMLNTTHTVVVSSNQPGAEVYIDGGFKGTIDNSYTLTVSDVYPGTHRIKVQSGSLSSEQDVEVSATNVYFRIRLNHEQAKPQYVFFEVNPKDATLVIENEPRPLDSYGQCTIALNNGSYEYSVSAKDHHTESGTFVVNGQKVEKQIKLKAAYGWLTVPNTSVLNGASIFIDEISVGKAPLSVYKLSSGQHKVRIVQNLYKQHEEIITITDEVAYTHAPKLVANFANVVLDGGEGSDIYVNATLKGKSPWTGRLAAGTYIFEARRAGHRTSSISKDVTPSEEKVTFNIPAPVAILGSINVKSTPGMADIYVDNQKVGRTPMSLDLVVGEHRLSIQKEGFQTSYSNVTITEGKVEDLDVTLNSAYTNTTAGSSSNTSIGTASTASRMYTVRYPVTNSSSWVWVYVDGTLVGSTKRTVSIPDGIHDLIVEVDGNKYYGNRMTFSSSTASVIDLTNAPRVASSKSVTSYYSSSSSSKSSSSSNSYKKKSSTNGWNTFNIGIMADVAYDTSTEKMAIGGGINCRMSKAYSLLKPTLGLRYLYNGAGINHFAIPLTLDFNLVRIFGAEWSWYMGVGIEPMYSSGENTSIGEYYDSYTGEYVSYTDSTTYNGWSLGFICNLFGLGFRHHDFNVYMSFDLNEDNCYVGMRNTYYF